MQLSDWVYLFKIFLFIKSKIISENKLFYYQEFSDIAWCSAFTNADTINFESTLCSNSYCINSVPLSIIICDRWWYWCNATTKIILKETTIKLTEYKLTLIHVFHINNIKYIVVECLQKIWQNYLPVLKKNKFDTIKNIKHFSLKFTCLSLFITYWLLCLKIILFVTTTILNWVYITNYSHSMSQLQLKW